MAANTKSLTINPEGQYSRDKGNFQASIEFKVELVYPFQCRDVIYALVPALTPVLYLYRPAGFCHLGDSILQGIYPTLSNPPGRRRQMNRPIFLSHQCKSSK